ncbi:phage tail assembly protein [Pantanalinema rosaneae CENA516]|uniref:phage tail assembly protein n=1 Tax=Pantanalinema rosaneae TaxID=1620701 RepID=UPI003D6FF82F
MLQTEFLFTLPLGYVDGDGNLHKEGVMRLATAFDEIAPLKDPRVQSNPGYLLIILLSRVITRLGSVESINPKVIEGLYAGDLAYLQDLYCRVNQNGSNRVRTRCPHCEKEFELELSTMGESVATP